MAKQLNMVQTKFLISKRFIYFLLILLLNPIPFLFARSIHKLSPFNLQVHFEGLLGCKYDLNICNENEDCFDDDLFGQCWNGQGSIDHAFTLKHGIQDLSLNKINALERTFKFLDRFELKWSDYLTQCILSYILSDHVHRRLNDEHIDGFYRDCLAKDKILNDIERNHIQRRFNNRQKLNYQNIGSLYLDSTMGVPLFLQYQEQPSSYFNENFQPILSDESKMQEPRKLLVAINEAHPGLLETLQINNNKQLLPIPNPKLDSDEIRTDIKQLLNSNDSERYITIETNRGFLAINRDFKDQIEAAQLLAFLARINTWPVAIFTDLNTNNNILTYRILENAYRINASSIASAALNNQKLIENQLGIQIIDSGIGNPSRGAQLSVEQANVSHWATAALVTCALVLFIMGSFVMLFYFKRSSQIRDKFAEITRFKRSTTNDYQDLCRQRMQNQPTTRIAAGEVKKQRSSESSSSRSSTSSWTEEPVSTINMDIMTGHLILSYMEDHLRDRHRLESDWQSLNLETTDDNERSTCSVALLESNEKKNRYRDCIPYDHTRIQLTNDDDEDGDYINASKITDSDPKCRYIATQGPLPNTTNAFWQMVWEQSASVIVALCRPIENGMTMCHHYWPVEGSACFNDFEVNLVSEHIWSDDYVVRSFYLKNLQTMETRTVTQFHYLTWDE